MINIISTFYITSSNLRNKELEACFVNNLSSKYIEKIHLFVDDNTALNKIKELSNNSEKLVIIFVGIKPKYSDFFKYILNNLKNKICMITNADIFLYECDNNLLENVINTNTAYALTRYEYNMSCPLINNYQGSHDCYIFNSKFIDDKIINENTNFYQNFNGIETRIIKSLCECGLKVYNPCYQIKIIHLHYSGIRNHGEWIGLHKPGDYEYFKKSCWFIPPVHL
jgi:hypothetical protein